jgi:hypothetical protein
MSLQADLFVTGDDGMTALDWARKESRADLVTFLEEMMAGARGGGGGG